VTGSGDTTFVPVSLRRRGVQRVVQAPTGAHDVTLLEGMARAFYWQHLIDTGQVPSGSDIARAEGVHHSVVNELLRLTLLAPDIVERFLDGLQPRRLTLMWFQRHSLPVDWDAQRVLVASFEGEA
jgi:hypothetical protein